MTISLGFLQNDRRVFSYTEDARCICCNELILIEFDADGFRSWFHQAWRHCSCPVVFHSDGSQTLEEDSECTR